MYAQCCFCKVQVRYGDVFRVGWLVRSLATRPRVWAHGLGSIVIEKVLLHLATKSNRYGAVYIRLYFYKSSGVSDPVDNHEERHKRGENQGRTDGQPASHRTDPYLRVRGSSKPERKKLGTMRHPGCEDDKVDDCIRRRGPIFE